MGTIMEREQSREIINGYIRTRDVSGLRAFLREHRSEDWFRSDLYLLGCLADVHEAEQKLGLPGLLGRYSDMDSLLSDHAALRRTLRRVEWWEDYPVESALFAIKEKGYSVLELRWAVNACCADRDRVWRRLQDAGRE